MPSVKLTKSAVDTAKPTTRDYEIRDTFVPRFLCKITPAGRKVFMLSYRTPTGERRKPALGTYGQITVDQARKLAQDFLASVRSGADPSHERQIARTVPTVKDLSDRFMVEHAEARNKPSTVKGNRITLRVHVLPALGKIKVADVKRSEIADLVGRQPGEDAQNPDLGHQRLRGCQRRPAKAGRKSVHEGSRTLALQDPQRLRPLAARRVQHGGQRGA